MELIIGNCPSMEFDWLFHCLKSIILFCHSLLVPLRASFLTPIVSYAPTYWLAIFYHVANRSIEITAHYRHRECALISISVVRICFSFPYRYLLFSGNAIFAVWMYRLCSETKQPEKINIIIVGGDVNEMANEEIFSCNLQSLRESSVHSSIR